MFDVDEEFNKSIELQLIEREREIRINSTMDEGNLYHKKRSGRRIHARSFQMERHNIHNEDLALYNPNISDLTRKNIRKMQKAKYLISLS